MPRKMKRLSPRKCITAVRAVHDILYLDENNGTFYNGEKEWTVDMLEQIAEIIGTIIPKPAGPTIKCMVCRASVFEHYVHIDRDGDSICENCWDDRMS